MILCAASLVGLSAGEARLSAIEGGALKADFGTELTLTGFAQAQPRFSRGVSRFTFDSDRGRVVVEAVDLPDGIRGGSGLTVSGTIRPPPDWYRPNLQRQGISEMLHARSIDLNGSSRVGVAGAIDRIRNRAEAALLRSMPEREAALAQGFVLGQDQDIDPLTVSDFQNSGLSHLLAVSGQNILLLSLLGVSVMAVVGVGGRLRLIVLAALILLYIPLAGGGASIQRAGVMGLAGLVALAADRPGSRIFVLALAAAVTLLINPRATMDIGWQLSFVAVIAIALLTGPIRARLLTLTTVVRRRPMTGTGTDGSSGGLGSSLRGVLIDGVAVTLAASLATAPLMAFHFDRIPVATLFANVAALPAVAPAMWLGMISAGLGLVWSGLAVPFNLLNSLLLAYIAQIAAWFGRPSWAVAEVVLDSAKSLLLAYLGLLALLAAVLWLTRDFGGERGEMLSPEAVRSGAARLAAFVAALVVAAVLVLPGSGRRDLDPPPVGGARIEFLDIGQGDATLIRPSGLDPILVDGGPPGGEIESALKSAGVDRLEAVIATHADLDHIGGLYEVFEGHEVGRYLFDGTPGDLAKQAKDTGAALGMLSEGNRLKLGPLQLEVLWPPPRGPGFTPPEDRNERSLVLLVSMGGNRILISGDAEAEAVSVDPGPVDVLRTAHHGSDDAGLEGFLKLARPELAVISVGADNTYGHPTKATLEALGAAGAETLRTDRDGTISLILTRGGAQVEAGK